MNCYLCGGKLVKKRITKFDFLYKNGVKIEIPKSIKITIKNSYKCTKCKDVYLNGENIKDYLKIFGG